VITKVGVEMIKQLAQRKALDVRMDDARLELIDVEQRVQHSRHNADGCVETLQERLQFRVVAFVGQQSLEKSDRLQRLPQIMAGGGEKARFGDARLFGGLRGGGERLGCALFFGDVRECDDDAFDQAVMGPVWQYHSIIPYSRVGYDFAFDGPMLLENDGSVSDQIAVVRERGEIGQRPTNVCRNHSEKRHGCGGEKANLEFFIQEDRGDPRTLQNVLQIVRRIALFIALKP